MTFQFNEYFYYYFSLYAHDKTANTEHITAIVQMVRVDDSE